MGSGCAKKETVMLWMLFLVHKDGSNVCSVVCGGQNGVVENEPG